jgi:dihydroorotate dehydrogenase
VRWYQSLIRPGLFLLSPDVAHDLAQAAFRWQTPWRLLGRKSRIRDSRLNRDLAGMTLDNPVGLAPGFDKNAVLVPSLDSLGFGYIVVGSVTRLPRQGNPRPRMARYPEQQALGNNLGLPSHGLEAVLKNLASLPERQAKLIVSVTGFTADELIDAAAAVEPFADAVELGLVCPNTTETERMAELEIFTTVVEKVSASKRKPVFVRLPPHHDDSEWQRARALLDVCLRTGVEGVSTNGRRRISDINLPTGSGSISGRATFADALRIVSDVADYTKGGLAIRASGGIFTGQQAAAMLAAGATTVEVYTSLIYRGPLVSSLINRELLATPILGPE